MPDPTFNGRGRQAPYRCRHPAAMQHCEPCCVVPSQRMVYDCHQPGSESPPEAYAGRRDPVTPWTPTHRGGGTAASNRMLRRATSADVDAFAYHEVLGKIGHGVVVQRTRQSRILLVLRRRSQHAGVMVAGRRPRDPSARATEPSSGYGVSDAPRSVARAHSLLSRPGAASSALQVSGGPGKLASVACAESPAPKLKAGPRALLPDAIGPCRCSRCWRLRPGLLGQGGLGDADRGGEAGTDWARQMDHVNCSQLQAWKKVPTAGVPGAGQQRRQSSYASSWICSHCSPVPTSEPVTAEGGARLLSGRRPVHAPAPSGRQPGQNGRTCPCR